MNLDGLFPIVVFGGPVLVCVVGFAWDEFVKTITAMGEINADMEIPELRDRIRAAIKRAESVSIFRPLGCYWALRAIRREIHDLEPIYYRHLQNYLLNHIQSPIKLGLHQDQASQEAIKIFGNILLHMNELQCLWNSLNATTDRKAAFGLGVLSLYISLISLFASVVSLTPQIGTVMRGMTDG
jgi:hypothetical protein